MLLYMDIKVFNNINTLFNFALLIKKIERLRVSLNYFRPLNLDHSQNNLRLKVLKFNCMFYSIF